MKLHCLGTAGYHPSDTRHTSCYAIPECALVFDAGTGFFRVSRLIQGDTLHVLLSHAHLDHVWGLTFVYDFFATTSLKHVHVYALKEKIAAIQTHLFNVHLFPIVPPIQWHALEELGKEFPINDVLVRWFELEHPGGSVGYCVQAKGTSFAYITDTTSTVDAAYWKEIQGVEWLLHECNFSDKYRDLAIQTGHSWTSAVLEGAKSAKINRLVLGHFNPLVDGEDPAQVYSSQALRDALSPEHIILATDGLEVELESL